MPSVEVSGEEGRKGRKKAQPNNYPLSRSMIGDSPRSTLPTRPLAFSSSEDLAVSPRERPTTSKAGAKQKENRSQKERRRKKKKPKEAKAKENRSPVQEWTWDSDSSMDEDQGWIHPETRLVVSGDEWKQAKEGEEEDDDGDGEMNEENGWIFPDTQLGARSECWTGGGKASCPKECWPDDDDSSLDEENGWINPDTPLPVPSEERAEDSWRPPNNRSVANCGSKAVMMGKMRLH